MLTVKLLHYGMSPWEIEVLYEMLNNKFQVYLKEIEQDEDNIFLSIIKLDISIAFNKFFNWFGLQQWDKLKSMFKEIKRRRGKNNSIKITICFIDTIQIIFIVDVEEISKFNLAIDKISFVLELLPYHLDQAKFPKNVIKINYIFDMHDDRWIANAITPKQKFVFINKSWKLSK
ncbi:MAG: hypothetical protein OXF28_03625 [Thaumarchaeota archaeon]|nr:hypothetical protein [Nitrososphaerota archaeon]